MERPKGMAPRKGLYPDADPTAPGGMSQDELIAEMYTYHGWDIDKAASLRWPEQIDAVIQGRLEREREAGGVPFTRDKKEEAMSDVYDEFVEAAEEKDSTALFIGMPGTFDYIFDGHSGASPSGAERWMNCTASLSAVRRFLETLTPNQQAEFARSSTAARQGTTAHAAAEAKALVALGRMTDDEADMTLMELAMLPESEAEAYDDEMSEYIEEYVDLVDQIAQERGAENILIEQRVSAIIPLHGEHEDEDHTITGSADAVGLPTPEDPDLIVIDLKYGEGIDVEVDENPQIRIYALGALDLLTDDEGNLTVDVETVTYYIVQPRLGGIKTWSESIDDLLDWRDDVLSPALTPALFGKAGGATFSPSDATCQWCPVKGSCPALIESRVEAARDLFEVVSETEAAEGLGALPNVEVMDSERLGSLYAQAKALTALADEMKAELQRRALRGDQIPGYKLVNYQPPRKWVDGAAEVLDPEHPDDWQADLWVRKLVTPTQALAVLNQSGRKGDDMLGELIDQPPKRPVIAPEGDRRRAWEGPAPEDMFQIEDEI